MNPHKENMAVLGQLVKLIPRKIIETLRKKHKIQTRSFSATTTEELRSIADCGKAAPWIYPGARGSPGETSPGWHFAFTIQDLSCRHKRRQRV